MQLGKLRPSKVRNGVRRRWFERTLARTRMHPMAGLQELGSSYGGWIMPVELIKPSWVCYSVGAGGDITFDLELISRFGVHVRAFDAVAGYVEEANEQAAGEDRFSAHHAAISVSDGPLTVQVTHDPQSRSVSSAGLYESTTFVEVPGRSLHSLMHEFGDERIDLLKLDVEGAEYTLLPTLDLHALGVKVFAVQLHHTGTVRDAKRLIQRLSTAGYEAVACRSAVKLTFAAHDLL